VASAALFSLLLFTLVFTVRYDNYDHIVPWHLAWFHFLPFTVLLSCLAHYYKGTITVYPGISGLHMFVSVSSSRL
jgi:hypothetical protein